MTTAQVTAPPNDLPDYEAELAGWIAPLVKAAEMLSHDAVARALDSAGLGFGHTGCASADELEDAEDMIAGLQKEHDELEAIADLAHEGHDRFGRATCGHQICRRFREAIG